MIKSQSIENKLNSQKRSWCAFRSLMWSCDVIDTMMRLLLIGFCAILLFKFDQYSVWAFGLILRSQCPTTHDEYCFRSIHLMLYNLLFSSRSHSAIPYFSSFKNECFRYFIFRCFLLLCYMHTFYFYLVQQQQQYVYCKSQQDTIIITTNYIQQQR